MSWTLFVQLMIIITWIYLLGFGLIEKAKGGDK